MDPRFLEQDEFLLECEIRDIDPTQPSALEILGLCFEEELKQIRDVPDKLHSQFKSVTGELSEIKWKLSSIVVSNGEPLELTRCHNRLLHLFGRVVRLEPRSNGHKQVERLRCEIEEGLTNLAKYAEAAVNSASQEQGFLTDGSAKTPNQTNQGVKPSQALSSSSAASAAFISTTHLPSSSQPAHMASEPQLNASISAVVPPQHSPSAGAVSQSLLPPATLQHAPASFVTSVPPRAFAFPTIPAPSTSFRQAPVHPDHPPYNTPTQIPNYPVQQLSAAGVSLGLESLLARMPNRSPPSINHIPDSANMNQESSRYAQPAREWSLPLEKWTLRFGGTSKDLPVDEFVFRIETLARRSKLSLVSLTLGLHHLLVGAAASWYWVFLRNEPDATWAQTRQALISAFQNNISDAAVRRLIADRLQRPGERFMEFNLAVQEMEVRLMHRMPEEELLETLRRNMLPHLQDRLLFLPIYSLRELQRRVQQVEELAQRQNEVQQVRRSMARINEIAALPPLRQEYGLEPPQDFMQLPPNPISFPQLQAPSTFEPFMDQPSWLSAMGIPAEQNQYIICWNCDEMGHTFVDCLAKRIIFCYGCGAKNCVRPQCPKCSQRMLQGNGPRSARPLGVRPNYQAPVGPALRLPNFNRPPPQ